MPSLIFSKVFTSMTQSVDPDCMQDNFAAFSSANLILKPFHFVHSDDRQLCRVFLFKKKPVVWTSAEKEI